VNTFDPSGKSTDASVLEETAEDLYEHAPCAYLSTLPDGTIVKVNQTFLEWTGADRTSLLNGTKFQTQLTIGSRIYYETHYAPLLRMQGFASEIAMDVMRADGRVLPVLVNTRQKRDADGTPLFNRITLFDSTDRRRYERELLLARRKAEQMMKDKGHLIAVLSHDIRNPLNALMGVVHMLDRSTLSDQQRRLVQLLKSSSGNMLDLLNHVLELSKAESSAFTLAEIPFKLPDAVNEVVDAFETTARGKGLQLRSSIDEDVPRIVIGDPLAMRQILSNLIGNAVKFTSAGSITSAVTTKEVGTDAVTLHFSVADTGVGIAPEMLGDIFNEYTQASYDTSVRYGGSGLGLAITQKLLALYGSRVHVESTPGSGSTFSFDVRLPLPRPDPNQGPDTRQLIA
jgi:PAS domain S-box-containing protein